MRFRKPGISTLLACQNEEAVVGLSIVSFLDFSDEIIVVDNGSTDRSKDICTELAQRFPEKVTFYDVPYLKDLYENRQFAFQRSQYQWVVRADADYVCYTDGPYNCMKLRSFLLEMPRLSRPAEVWLPQPDLHGDFWHTGRFDQRCDTNGRDVQDGPRLNCVSQAMARIYRTVPGTRFDRLGRWEGVVRPKLFQRLLRRIRWKTPIWMHCSLKSNENFFFRRERTNWRELGDYENYPTLKSYVCAVIMDRYGTNNIEEATQLLLQDRFFPRLVRYDPEKLFPYPRLICETMKRYRIYHIEESGGKYVRRYTGPPDIDFLVGLIRSESPNP